MRVVPVASDEAQDVSLGTGASVRTPEGTSGLGASVRQELRDGLGLRSPHVTHGAHLVALTSFGTVIAVSLVAATVAAVFAANFPVALALLIGAAGGLVGFVLWSNGQHALATTLHVSGLLGAGLLCLLATGSVGGATAVLLLASVITAGGLMGWRAVIVDLLACTAVLTVGWTLAEPLQQLFGITANYTVPEPMMVAFVASSLPSWGAYVVAIDTSNRVAWLRAQASVAVLGEKTRAQRVQVESLKLELALAHRRADQARMLRMLAQDHLSGLPVSALQKRCEGALAHWRIPGGLNGLRQPTGEDPGADAVALQDAAFREGLAELLALAHRDPGSSHGATR